MRGRYVLAVDQGTTSTRALVVDHAGDVVASSRLEHRQHLPRAGWVEHDATEIWRNVRETIGSALALAEVSAHRLAAVGITNQRETTVVWDRVTGRPIHRAVVWQDVRTAGAVDALAAGHGHDRWAQATGLPLSTYFAGPKIAWLLDHVPGARERAEAGELLFGTMDTWLLWNMTGGPDGGVHVTDVTNASRTLLLDLRTLAWDERIAAEIGVPLAMLPQVRSSAEVYGEGRAGKLLAGVPIAGILGDQQAATLGQACLTPGMVKNTYGTGNFVLRSTGEQIVRSEHGLITTVAAKLGDSPVQYALEGSVAVTGSLVQWLRDNLGLITAADQVERLALSVPDNGGVYLVPAFSGLFAPHWRPEARGVLAGMTGFTNAGHIARAALEATAFQSREVIEAMNADVGAELTELRVDGGMTANETLMQFQADVLGVPVVRPAITETTALGAAFAAGIAVGFWDGPEDVASRWREDRRWEPAMAPAERDRLLRAWRKAVSRTFDWLDADTAP